MIGLWLNGQRVSKHTVLQIHDPRVSCEGIQASYCYGSLLGIILHHHSGKNYYWLKLSEYHPIQRLTIGTLQYARSPNKQRVVYVPYNNQGWRVRKLNYTSNIQVVNAVQAIVCGGDVVFNHKL